MPTAPYQRRTLPEGGGQAITARTPALDLSAAQGSSDLGRGAGDLAQGLLAQDLVRRRETEDAAALEVGKQLSEGRAFWLEQTTARADGFKVTPETPYGSLQSGVLQDFDKWKADELSKAPTVRSRQFLDSRLTELRGTLQNETFKVERAKRMDHQVATLESSRQVDRDTVYQYPELRATVLGERLAAIDALSGISEEAKVKLKRAEHVEINEATERGELDRDPRAWYRTRFGGDFQGKGGKFGGAGASGTFGSPTAFNFPTRVSDGTRSHIALINESAEKAGVDQNVLTALVEQESRGNTRAVSSKGARGLVQLMPGTAAELKVADPHDPKQAVPAGAAYLGQQLQHFGGDYEKALAAYNGGRGRVEAAIAKAAKSGGSWIDYVPAESRDYVRTILANVKAPDEGQVTTKKGPDGEAPARTAEPRDGPSSWLGLPYEKREALRAHAEIVIAQRTTAQLGVLKDRVANAEAMAKGGLADPAPITDAEFEAAGPEGMRLKRSYDLAQQTAAKVGSFEQLPSDQIVAAVRESTPKPGELYREEAELSRATIAAASAVMQQRDKDPAQAVLAYHGPAQKAWAAVVESQQPGVAPEAQQRATAAYAAVMAEEQERLRLPGAARVVPQAYADQVVRMFTESLPSGKVAEQLVAMERQWGRHWPKVLAQVQKDLPAAAVVISDVDSPAVREQIARVATIKMADLKAGLDPADVKAAELAVAKDGVMTSFRLSLEPTGNGSRVFGQFEETIQRLTLSNMRQGMKASDAARDAVDRVIGDKYEFKGPDARPYAVPKAERPELVDAGTKAVLAGLAETSLMLPVDRLGAGTAGELTPADLKRQYVQKVREQAVWVRSPDDDGLRLYGMGFDGRLREVVRSDGRPLQFTWQQLRSAALDASPGGSTFDRFRSGSLGADPKARSASGRIGGY